MVDDIFYVLVYVRQINYELIQAEITARSCYTRSLIYNHILDLITGWIWIGKGTSWMVI